MTRLASFLKKALYCLLSVLYAAAPLGSRRLSAQTAYSAEIVSRYADANVSDTIADLKKTIPTLADGLQKKASLELLASCEERQSSYSDAAAHYYDAAYANPQEKDDYCLLAAARCAIEAGDGEAADSYIKPLLLTARDGAIVNKARLYSAWSMIISGKTADAAQALEAYLASKSMANEHPAALFTLWHITANEQYKERLIADYPLAPETRIAKNGADLAPSPFWYFMPRSVAAAMKAPRETRENQKDSAAPENQSGAKSNAKAVFYQTGFFRVKEYALALQNELREKGFAAVLKEAPRPSGTVYFSVGVYDDEENSIAPRLRDAGYECSPVFEED